MSAAARILETPDDWQRNTVTLLMRDESGGVLMQDGKWTRVEEGVPLPAHAGLLLPRHLIEPLAAAISTWQGHASHADTEARVLREWLALERERVDGLVYAAVDRVRRPLRSEP